MKPCLSLVAFASLTSLGLVAQEANTNQLNRFSFSPRAAFNVTATFRNAGLVPFPPNNRATPNGDAYNYDNGYLLTDISGNAGGLSWYWGYDSAGQAAGAISLSRSSLAANGTSTPESVGEGVNFGGELAYNRELFAHGEVHYGVEVAASFLDISLSDDSALRVDVNQTTDSYGFTPGTTPPLAPYQGTFQGPGFLLNASPADSTSTLVSGGALVTGHRKFTANLWGLRGGPSAEFPVLKYFRLSLSGGVAAGVLDADANWTETIAAPTGSATASGSGHTSKLLFGGYLGGQLSWQVNDHWSAQAGVQYQNLGTCNCAIGGRVVEVDLSKTIFVSVGVDFRF